MRFLRRRHARFPTTGHAGDDMLLEQLATQSDLSAGRHWVHYLYVGDEAAARVAAGEIEAAGWVIDRVDEAAEGPGWVVIAEKHDVVVSPEAVVAARELFEGVAARVPGGDYDGWEASV
ncbi:ribonuclease E inhibitor RraB [Blastococcus sp. PRF04-17]|uniref:ribonuclease E inhibitor RraB n=1 Tax=Blastococcus sp. PRF04-17 TaxID=2933797 RepID=UPI001FF5B79D|nr:ribonuclease E inhibitor RraB [Blastococcus sp. PRF04-17]UOY01148.1 ribonuclease E inhibitor RraB [Blastococcus sp. PRF04-17]